MPVELGEWELRSIFNESGIWEATLAGETMALRVVRDPTPDNKQPDGTLSVTTTIYEKDHRGNLGRKVAITHHYEDPDGRILNAAGRPDPKMVRTGGQFYVLAR